MVICKIVSGEYSDFSHLTAISPRKEFLPVMMGILLLCIGSWQAVIPLGMSVFFFVFLALCRSAAENEIPQIRQAFENTLRKFEEKYCGEDHA